MKNKEYICPNCKIKCKYRGGRRFYCKKCKNTYEVEREFEPPNKTPIKGMFNI